MGKKNYKKGRKLATYALASAMVLSSFGAVTPAFASTTYKPGDLEAKVKQLKEQQTRKENKANLAKEARAGLKATDKVRVIVEVEGQTPVEYATKQGKLYKELSEDKKSSLTAKADSQQKAVKEKISAKGINVKYKQKFSTAFNGFSGEVAYGDLSKIEAISGVKNVYLANEYNRPVVEPNMKTSHQFIQSHDTWSEAGFKGEGMVVAVIDTGVDPSHKDFKLSDPAKEELTKTEVAQTVQENGLKGKFYTDKVPYGYNYYDQNSEILDLGPAASMHGMHVAGTVAANGDVANGGIKGVAPEAQVLGMKVFSNDPLYPSTWSDIYLAAIDDSIKLGADVLNMSLGSTASFYDENSAEDLAIQRATANGIVCATSAGNSNAFGNGWDNPYAKNPDIGLVGAPGLNPDTISVAAAGNEAYRYSHAIKVEGNTSFSSVGYGLDDWTKLVADNGGKLELVSIGDKLGNLADYQGLDVKGKVVVVPRGGLTFIDKTKNAAAAGAAGIIVWNATNGFFYEDQGGWDIPFMHITKAEGETLNAAIAAGQTTLTVSQAGKTEDPEMGRITDFSSWGTTPSLEMKPEITAPGGNILSTVNNNKYELMSGTSMAAPHVAGGSALVQQYLQTDKRFGDLSVKERTELAKVLLMNTSKIIYDLHDEPFSPRAQGAGMMQLQSAVTTPAYVVNKETGEAKVELKDFNSTQFSMTFSVKNISDKDVTYRVNTDVLTDVVEKQADGPDYNAKRSADLEGAVVNGPKEVSVAAGASTDFTVTVDFTNAKIQGLDAKGQKVLLDLYKNIFVEGSVNLVSSDSAIPSLTVPYIGFYGNWDEPEVVDGFATLGENRFYNLADYFGKGATDAEDKDGYFVSPVPEKNVFALSPNGDGEDDGFNPIPSFLRNASEVQFNILDSDGNQLRRVKAEADVRKNYFDGGRGAFYSYNGDRMWDGTVKGEAVKDGLYYYEIKSIIDYEGAQWQSKKIPLYVDTTAPKVTATYDPEKSAVSWETKEDGTGIEIVGVFVNGKLVGTADGKTTTYQLTDAPEKAIVEVLAFDYAGNAGDDTAAIGDVDMPLIYLTDGTKDSAGEYVANSPEPYGAYKTSVVPVKGFLVDDIGVKSLTVNGKDVPFTRGADGKVSFSTTVTFDKDGQYDVIVEVVDHSNKKFAISRKVFIDTTGPVINTDAPERVNKSVDKVTFNVNLQDNYNYISFYVGEDNLFEVPVKSPVDLLTPLNKNTTVTVPLVDGANTVVLRAVDLAGNETVQEVVINRANESGWVEQDGAWYYYEDGTKHTGWLELTNFDEEWGYEWTDKYYFDEDGKMQTGWLELDGSRYYFTEYGPLLVDTIEYVSESKNYFLFDENGAAKTGIESFFDQKAYFDAKTGLAKNAWKLVDGVWYYATADGTLKTGWLEIANKWYFFNNEAEMQTGWVTDGKASYYLTESGAMATGWALIDGKWYYFNNSGAKLTGWVLSGKSWYFLGSDGVMKTGWLQDANGKWYYLNNNGDMATGWKLVGNKWYYFYSSGTMAANTTVDGYKLGTDGAWIR
jgi:lactocepin